MCGYLWYTSPKSAALLFFNENVPLWTTKKEKIVTSSIFIKKKNKTIYCLT